MIKSKIIWLTGQPSSGKTVLGKKLVEYFKKNILYPTIHIDGDDLREVITNKDYSKEGRINNIRTAQNIAKFLHHKSINVIVSLVSPYKWLRDEFKMDSAIAMDLNEIYIHTTEKRERDNFHVKDYEPPIANFIDVDTTIDTPDESVDKIIKELFPD